MQTTTPLQPSQLNPNAIQANQGPIAALYAENQYLDLLRRILDEGVERPDRTGTGTLAIFGAQMRFNLAKGFPLFTTKKVHLRSIIYELLWILRGDTNVKWLQENKITIWDEWADENGDLGPIYGKQWRDWVTADGRHIDQISELVNLIKKDPYSRRQIVSAWNVGDLAAMKLAPCHSFFQTTVMGNKLHLQLYMRSSDVFLGLPFNIPSYALFLIILAEHCGLEPGDLIWTGGDVHIYLNHLEQVKTQLSRQPFAPPQMRLNRISETLDGYNYEDFELLHYASHPGIKAPVAI
ncbi:thymidylate synthase [Nostoc sp. CHAB 5834]|nr:thymidylate synthase [Nostoc sp. CHAB 5834]